MLKIIKASAGSGKTYTLTREYLALLFKAHNNPQQYSEILAVTFTNKATEEMKLRILEELRNMALGKSGSMATEILEQLNAEQQVFFSPINIKRFATNVYRNILHNYSRFQVSTIDSFVQRVIKAFIYEIGMDSGYRIEMNTNKVTDELVQELFAQMETDEHLRESIFELSKERLDNDKNWDFKEELIKLVGQIYNEPFFLFQEDLEAIDKTEGAEEFLKNAKKTITTQVAVFEAKMAKLGEKALGIIHDAGLSLTDFANKERGFVNTFNKLQNKNYELNLTYTNAIDSQENWTTKTASAAIKNSVDAIFPALNDVMVEIKNNIDNELVAYSTAKAVQANVRYFMLIKRISDNLKDYCLRNNIMLMSDTTKFLKVLVEGNDAPFIYEKVGTRYKHFLLDEFQDTSLFQWQNFKPLVENGLAENGTSLIVGDVKQAIYRWRNGDWSLLQSQVAEQMQQHNTIHANLAENYRSSTNIIEFNNFLYRQIPEVLDTHFGKEIAEIAAQNPQWKAAIAQIYSDSKQNSHEKTAQGGSVKLQFYSQQKEECASVGANNSFVAQQIYNQLPQLLNEDLGKKKIAFLVRKNGEAQLVIHTLLTFQNENPEYDFTVVSPDALTVGNSIAVQVIEAAMQLVINPVDSLQLIRIKKLLAELNTQQHDAWHSVFTEVSEQLQAFLNDRSLLHLPVSQLCEHLINIFNLSSIATELPYLIAMQDLVQKFSGDGNTGLGMFLEWWGEEGSSKTIPLPENKRTIIVLTVHKSKGLAFDTVVLPFASWGLFKQNELFWASNSPLDASVEIGKAGISTQLRKVPIRASQKLANTNFASDFFEEKFQSYLDALNILYVATTRAKSKLIIYARVSINSKGEHKINTIGDLLYQAIMDNPEAIKDVIEGDNEWLYTINDTAPKQIETEQKSTEVDKYHSSPIPLMGYQQSEWLTTYDEKRKSNQRFSFIANENDAQQEGSLLHDLLAHIETVSDIESVVEKAILQGEISEKKRQEYQSKLRHVVQNKLVKHWFDGSFVVMNEQGIIDNDGTLKRPDRILMRDNKVVVVDYKFTQGKSASHQHQVQNYRKLLKAMNYEQVEGFLYYPELGEVVEVTDGTAFQTTLQF